MICEEGLQIAEETYECSDAHKQLYVLNEPWSQGCDWKKSNEATTGPNKATFFFQRR